uniref:Putative ixostatin n=1 Tax=Ixodes ricinus TaxID=34613 RepID=A0A0K8RBW7_IXORI
MILPMSVVLLATSDYIHATQCRTGLSNYMETKCKSFSSAKLKYTGFSGCSFTCEGTNADGQTQSTTHNLENGLPCGPCEQCCSGKCTPVSFKSYNPLCWKSCAEQRISSRTVSANP